MSAAQTAVSTAAGKSSPTSASTSAPTSDESAPANRPLATSGAIAARLNAELIGPPDLALTHFEAMERAGPGGLTFIRSGEFASGWPVSKAAAALVTRGTNVPGHDASTRALLIVPDADLALVQLLEAFAPRPALPSPGIHPSSVVDPSAKISPKARIGPLCAIGPDATIGDDTVLVERVSIASNCRVGNRSILHPGVAIYSGCSVGSDCVLHANVVIGADGFGYRPAPDGRGVVKIPHVGTAEIHDHVELGAGTCIDRAKFGATVVGAGSKFDNMVQVAHGCRVGRCVLIAAHTALGGSVTVGDGSQIGGNSAISDGVTIGPGCRIGGQSAVMREVEPGAMLVGMPAIGTREFFRMHKVLREVTDFWPRVRAMLRTHESK
jgi:UDP-3-O-[3-hydroxymyristoyl] glucosamine N-acyltransferase